MRGSGGVIELLVPPPQKFEIDPGRIVEVLNDPHNLGFATHSHVLCLSWEYIGDQPDLFQNRPNKVATVFLVGMGILFEVIFVVVFWQWFAGPKRT